ncbi:MAG: T9SS type A sorting domain-containing protein [Flavobacteriales bacterium]|nr:T9SS type A sorting domain-containing protein [Flavobacteriales bacterium]
MTCLLIWLHTPTVDFIGEELASSVQIVGNYQDEVVAMGSDSIAETLTCAYDPNDKQVFPVGYSEEHYVHPDSTLEFLVRFQNTGNAPATDVIIRDTIDDDLDLGTFELVANSHSVFTTVKPNDREVEFYFQNIMLPDSVNNEPESHGLVSYRMKPIEGTPLLTELNNTAHIFFDTNPPIVTNTTWSTLYDCSLFEVSFTDEGALLTASEGDTYQWFLDGEEIEGAIDQEYLALQNGNYSVQVGTDFPCSDISTSTFVVVSSIAEWADSQISLFPNPLTTTATLDLGDLPGPATLEIHDLTGKLLRTELLKLDSGILTLQRGKLSSGRYVLRVISGRETMEVPFVVD